jgi:hypothetical protein
MAKPGDAISEHAKEPPADERLRELLAVEARLQELVRLAQERAARQIAAAREARDRRLAEARDAAVQADAARSEEERAAHQHMLAAIEHEHQRVVAAINGLSDERIDGLARWALDQVIGADGDAA